MKRFLIFPLLAACAQIGGPLDPGFPDAANDTCNAAIHARLIGSNVNSLEKIFILQPVRVIGPNQAVTMDFLEHRINFHVTTTRIIEKITCG